MSKANRTGNSHLKPGWIGLWATCSSGRRPCPWHRGQNQMIFKVIFKDELKKKKRGGKGKGTIFIFIIIFKWLLKLKTQELAGKKVCTTEVRCRSGSERMKNLFLLSEKAEVNSERLFTLSLFEMIHGQHFSEMDQGFVSWVFPGKTSSAILTYRHIPSVDIHEDK